MSEFQPKPFGKYFLVEKLATGGMAEIYKAKTFGAEGFEKQLAIKRILPHCATDKEFISMLIDEAKLSVLLSHTNVAQVFDLGKVGDDYFISMEFVDGINLRELMNRTKELGEPMPEDVAVYIVSEMCKGLDYAHAKKDLDGNPLHIVHRDISPQNVLISYEGEVKIVDFGIAKAAMNISHTMAGVLKGKITYMSPEQALGKPVDYKTDLFSTGIILYELITGQKLFTGETQFEVLKKIRTTRITQNSFPESIPVGLRAILAKALAYSPRDRFENSGDMQIELTKFLYSTYLDFSPRKLSNLMRRIFATEIQNKKAQTQKSDLSIDAQTRSILLDAESQENIVHRDEAEKTNIDQAIQSTQTFMDSFLSGESTAETTAPEPGTQTRLKLKAVPTPTATPPLPEEPRRSKNWMWASLMAVILALAVGAYLGYPYLFPPQKPAPTQKVGSLVVNSVPPGAKIFLNDKDMNLITPATIPDVELNISQKVTLKKDKFTDWSRLVTLISPQPLEITPTLDPIPTGTVAVTTQPPGAKVWLDGQDLNQVTPTQITKLDLQKSYTLRLEKPDYHPVEERITIFSVEPVKYEKKLEEIKYGTVEIKTTPPGAKIFLNNQDTQMLSPNRLAKLEVGKTYTIRLAQDKYRDVVRNLEITGDKPILISEKMINEEELKKKEEEEKKKLLEKQKTEQEKQAKLEEKKKEEAKTLTPDEQKKAEEARRKAEEEARKKAQQEEAKKTAEAKKQQEDQQKSAEQKKETTPPTPSGPAYVAVNSNPSGAEVYINGVRMGSTPGKFQVQSGGSVEVVVTKPGAGRATKVVALKAGETKSLGTIELGGEFGSLRIESNPPGASVYVDGQSTGRKTPLIVKGVRRGKEHSVKLELDGYESWSRSFSMDDDSKSFIANLKQK